MYTIYIKTSNVASAGTDGAVNMDINGEDLSFNTGNLDQSDRNDRQADRYMLKFSDGKIYSGAELTS